MILGLVLSIFYGQAHDNKNGNLNFNSKMICSDRWFCGKEDSMILYKNLNGNSNVLAYEIGPDYINVQFKGTAKIYCYSYQSAGAGNVEAMKRLAQNGSGLNSFINKNVKYLYVK
jgi:hypothetical protein